MEETSLLGCFDIHVLKENWYMLIEKVSGIFFLVFYHFEFHNFI